MMTINALLKLKKTSVFLILYAESNSVIITEFKIKTLQIFDQNEILYKKYKSH